MKTKAQIRADRNLRNQINALTPEAARTIHTAVTEQREIIDPEAYHALITILRLLVEKTAADAEAAAIKDSQVDAFGHLEAHTMQAKIHLMGQPRQRALF